MRLSKTNKKNILIFVVIIIGLILAFWYVYIPSSVNYKYTHIFQKGFYQGNDCGFGDPWNANPLCVCPGDKLKKKYLIMCDPISCPPFYKCIDNKECELNDHYGIVGRECVLR